MADRRGHVSTFHVPTSLDDTEGEAMGELLYRRKTTLILRPMELT